MAQPQKETKRRRSSIIAQNAGIKFEPNKMAAEIMKILPSRNSASMQASRRSSAFGALPEATPTTSQIPPQYKKPSSIPRPSAQKSGAKNQTRPLHLQPPSARASGAPSTATRKINYLGNGHGVAANPRKTLRRSISFDGWKSMATPSHTPSKRSRSKSPTSCRSVTTSMIWASNQELDKGMIAKNLKAPSSTDKKSLHVMADFVIGFLNSHGYSKPHTTQSLSKIHTSEFQQICKFLGSIMFGADFGVPSADQKGDKSDDFSTTILELTQELKYPGTLKKSDLKTPTVPHSWPFVLTFLTWFCCRITAWENYKDPLNLDLNREEEEILLESYMNLFYAGLSDPNYDFETAAEKEIDTYKKRIVATVSPDLKSKEELLALRDEKLKQKEEVEKVPDPRQDLLKQKAANATILAEIKKRKAEMQQELKKYQNRDLLKNQKERLQATLARKKKELAEKEELVKNQKMTKDEAQRVLADIEDMRRQKVVIVSINNDLRMQVEAKKQNIKKLESKFYDKISKFSIVEVFNQGVLKLKLNVKLIPRNPVAMNELKDWLKDLTKELKTTKKEINRMNAQIIQEIGNAERDLAKLNNEYAVMIKKMEEIKKKQRNVDSELLEKERREDAKIQNMKADLEALDKDLEALKELNNGYMKSLDTVTQKFEDMKKVLEEETKKEKCLDEKVQRDYLTLEREKAYVNLELERIKQAFAVSVNELFEKNPLVGNEENENGN